VNCHGVGSDCAVEKCKLQFLARTLEIFHLTAGIVILARIVILLAITVKKCHLIIHFVILKFWDWDAANRRIWVW